MIDQKMISRFYVKEFLINYYRFLKLILIKKKHVIPMQHHYYNIEIFVW